MAKYQNQANIRLILLLVIITMLVSGCFQPTAKFVAPDFEAPRRVAVLPSHNHSVDVEAGFAFRQVIYQMMLRANYVNLVMLSNVDSVLNDLGITDAGQLTTIKYEELCRALRADGLIYSDLLEAQLYSFKHIAEQQVKANLKLFRYPTGRIWEAEQHEVGQAFFGGLFSRMRYDFPEVGDHELVSHMEDILIRSFKTLPGYIDRDFPAVVYGIEAGYFIPTGPWNNHPYAEGIAQFSGGPGIGVEIEQKLTSVGWGLGFNYTWLTTGEWENYMADKGEKLEGSGYFYTIDLLFKMYPWVSRDYLFKLELGLNYLQAGGEETFRGETYDYDFLSWGIGITAGIEYDRFISEYTALALRFRYLNAFESVDYSNNRKYNLSGFQVNLGIKYYY